MVMLNLLCYVRGDDFGHTFVINIEENETVSDLQTAIKERERPKFDDIPTSLLYLWKASIHYNSNLKKEVEALNLVYDNKLLPPEILSDVFSSRLETKCVHTIIDCGKLQLPMPLFDITFFPKPPRSPYGITLCQSV